MQNHPRTGGWLINVGCRWNAGKNRAPAPPARVYARSDFREIRGFLRIILPPLHAALSLSLRGKKAMARAGKSAATFRLRYANRATRPITPRFWRERARKPGGKKKKKRKKRGKKKKKKAEKETKKVVCPASGLWLDRVRVRGAQGREGGEVERAKKSRECCKNPGPPIGRIVSSR